MRNRNWTEYLLLQARQLHAIFVLLLILLFGRIFLLTTAFAPFHLDREKKLQQRHETVRAERGEIYDANGLNIVSKKPIYMLTLNYKEISSIPAVRVEKVNSKSHRRRPRQEYIEQLCAFLTTYIPINHFDIKDFIYGEVALNLNKNHVLYVGLSESDYLALEKVSDQWPGLTCEVYQRRFYNNNSSASQLVGYMGWMTSSQWRREYDKSQALLSQIAIEEDESEKFYLKEALDGVLGKMYRYRDRVGCRGLERTYESWFRGQYQKYDYQINSKGENRRNVEKPSLSIKEGGGIRLTIDRDLQSYCEKLLAASQLDRDQWMSHHERYVPWVKPAAVVVMNPYSGAILAMASYPFFDANVFSYDIEEASPRAKFSKEIKDLENQRHRYQEDSVYRKKVWLGQQPLKRESCKVDSSDTSVYEEEIWPSAQDFISICAGDGSQLIDWFQKHSTIPELYEVLFTFDQLHRYLGYDFSAEEVMHFVCDNKNSSSGQRLLRRYFEVELAIGLNLSYLKTLMLELDHITDRLLALDLISVFMNEGFSLNKENLHKISLDRFYRHLQMNEQLIDYCYHSSRKFYREKIFQEWRVLHQHSFLKQCRREEKLNHRQPKIYTAHLDSEYERQFKEHWSQYGVDIVKSVLYDTSIDPHIFPEIEYIDKGIENDFKNSQYIDYKEFVKSISYEEAEFYRHLMRPYKDLDQPLRLHYSRLAKRSDYCLLDLANKITDLGGRGFTQNRVVSEASAPGSIFKLVVAYEALRQRHERGEDLNPLCLYDNNYPLKSSSNSSDWIVARTLRGKAIPQFYKGGRLPRSLRRHIGEIDLLGALESSSNPYFSLLAAESFKQGGKDLFSVSQQMGYGEKSLIGFEGESRGHIPLDLDTNKTGLYTAAIGQHTLLATPLQTAVMLSSFANGGLILEPYVVSDWMKKDENIIHHQEVIIRRQIDMPGPVNHYILEGMRRVVSGKNGKSRFINSTTTPFGSNAYQSLISMTPYMVGKTSTSEVNARWGISPSAKIHKISHTWFGAISFDRPLVNDKGPIDGVFQKAQAELVVVVLFKNGNYGREAVPICARIIDYYKQSKLAAE